ncbi:hypothetical protein NE237_007694 [Protea cynaroides]|uniref:Uncharacterized protein n=1 Tax=Protea cynaroides TaxID=273540 RepID=A0A9Q0QWP7_9MAGN|nr:hypothetical protein NE237_007694 [Protea cynaroides]
MQTGFLPRDLKNEDVGNPCILLRRLHCHRPHNLQSAISGLSEIASGRNLVAAADSDYGNRSHSFSVLLLQFSFRMLEMRRIRCYGRTEKLIMLTVPLMELMDCGSFNFEKSEGSSPGRRFKQRLRTRVVPGD